MSKLVGPAFVLVCLLLPAGSWAASDLGAVGLSAASLAPDGRLIPGDASRGATCVEVDDLPQDCGVTPPPSTCLDAVPLTICVRRTTRTRITMCAKENVNSHEGHAFTWQLVEGALPSALILKDFSKSTAYVGGDLPTIDPPPGDTNGKYFGRVDASYCGSFKILATDTCSAHTCVSNFPITFRTIDPGTPVLPVITTASFPDAVLGVFYSQQITAVGGVPLKIYSISVGTLPPGLSIDPTTGALEGTPTQAGDFPVTLRVLEDSNDPLLQPDPGCPGAVCAPLDDTEQYTLRVLAVTPTPTATVAPTATRTPTPTVTPRVVPSNVVIDAQLPPDFTSAYSFSLSATSLLTVVASLVSPCVAPERGASACEVYLELFDPSGQSRARILLTTSPQTLVFHNAEPGTWRFTLSVSAGCSGQQCIRVELASQAALPSGSPWPLALALLTGLVFLRRRVWSRRL